MIYIVIVLAKIVEVSMATVRIVLITKGERKIGAFIGFFEVSLWLVLVSTVLTNIMADPLKIVAYALGFALGNYIGSMVEEKIGIGSAEVQAIVKSDHGPALASTLRDQGFAVTVMHGEGKSHSRDILLMYISRKKVRKCVELIKAAQENSVITVSDKKPIYGGFGMLRK